MTGRKLGKWQKNLNCGEEKVWNELLCKYVIYAPNVKQIHAFKLVLEANGKYDWQKIGKLAKKPHILGGKRSETNYKANM